MDYHKVPSIILLLDHDDTNTFVSGVLDFKGCKVYKSRTVDDCLSTLNRHEREIDVVLIKKELATDKNFMLVRNIRKITAGTMIMILADFTNKDDKLTENGVDEIVLTPMSAENLGDKIIMLIAKKELKEIKEENG